MLLFPQSGIAKAGSPVVNGSITRGHLMGYVTALWLGVLRLTRRTGKPILHAFSKADKSPLGNFASIGDGVCSSLPMWIICK